MMQLKVANNVTGNQDEQSESSYKDDFESDGFSAYDNSFASSKMSNSKTFKMQRTGNNGEPLDEDDMLLQESRYLHQKIKA